MKKNILIVGKNGTIGSALIDHFEKDGSYQVYSTSSSNSAVFGSYCFHMRFDASTHVPSELAEVPFDHIIVASGYEPQFNLFESTSEHIHVMFQVHVTGPMQLLQQLVPNMRDHGSIVLFSSPAAQKGSYDPSYSAVKGAVNSLVKTLAKDFAPKIRVNAISPSLVEQSTVYNRMTADFRQKHINNTLTKKNTTTEDCVQAIEFLIQAPQVTGQVLQVNGGMI